MRLWSKVTRSNAELHVLYLSKHFTFHLSEWLFWRLHEIIILDTDMGSSVRSLPILLLTFRSKLVISAYSYSAQLNVRNKVGEPNSFIMHVKSFFFVNQYRFVPRTDWSMVASSCSSDDCTLEPQAVHQTTVPCLVRTRLVFSML